MIKLVRFDSTVKKPLTTQTASKLHLAHVTSQIQLIYALCKPSIIGSKLIYEFKFTEVI